MKLTKSQLKQTVKEELEGILNEEGTSPKELGLPLDVGTPEKLLQGLQALLANPEQIEKDNITHIVNLINKQLMKNPDEAAAAALKAAKDEVIGLDPGMSKMRSWRQARRDKAREDAEGAYTPSTSRDFYSSGGPTFEGKLKITKSQLKQIIKEEFEAVTEAPQLAEFEGGPEVDIQDAIQMLEAEEDSTGTLFHVINRLYEALDKLGGESGLKYVGQGDPMLEKARGESVK